jgi:hypothetical protein
VLVCIDEFGGGTQVPVTRQEAYAREVETLGGHVEIRRYPASDHFSVSHDAINDIREWVVSKLASTGCWCTRAPNRPGPAAADLAGLQRAHADGVQQLGQCLPPLVPQGMRRLPWSLRL